MSWTMILRVLGVFCSLKEWKFLNSAMLVVEDFNDEEPVADIESS
jgi:hypothetical protein